LGSSATMLPDQIVKQPQPDLAERQADNINGSSSVPGARGSNDAIAEIRSEWVGRVDLVNDSKLIGASVVSWSETPVDASGIDVANVSVGVTIDQADASETFSIVPTLDSVVPVVASLYPDSVLTMPSFESYADGVEEQEKQETRSGAETFLQEQS